MNKSEFNSMTRRERLKYMGGGYVTVGKIEIAKDKRLATKYVAKVRGKIIGKKGEKFKFDSPEKAREYGHEIKEYWESKLQEIECQ